MLAGVLGEQEVSVRLADGVLSGTWLQPDPCHAACVLIAGSGPTNRDGHAGNGGVGACARSQKLCVSTVSPASATTNVALRKVDSRRWWKQTCGLITLLRMPSRGCTGCVSASGLKNGLTW